MSELYRIKPQDGVVWITGASTGIGKALAEEMARRGYRVAASARSVEALEGMESSSQGWAGDIRAFPVDVTDKKAMAATVAAIINECGPIRMGVFNAGNFWPTKGEALSIENFEKTYAVNFFGIINGLVPLVEHMKAQGMGHVALTGSVSAYAGLPSAAAYGGSKAAINNMAEALKFDFDKLNIRVQVINPGFIDTPLTEQNDFDMPALVPVPVAAKRMADGFETGGFEITFPRRFTWMLKVVKMLPHWLYFPLMRKATNWGNQTLDFGETQKAATIRTI